MYSSKIPHDNKPTGSGNFRATHSFVHILFLRISSLKGMPACSRGRRAPFPGLSTAPDWSLEQST